MPLTTPESFGCVGDGVTNDYADFQAACTALKAAGGGTLDLTPGKTYRIVINASTPSLGLVVGGIDIRFNGATVNFECDSTVYCFRPLNHTKFLGPGSVNVTASTGLGAANQAIYHAPIAMGFAYGDGGTPASPSPFAFVSDIVIEGLTFTSARSAAAGSLVHGFGGMSGVRIRNNVFPDNSNMAIAIGFDWAPLPYGGSTPTQFKTAFNAGTFYSVHPHDLVIEDNQIGNFNLPFANGTGSMGVRLSGVYSAAVSRNDIQRATFAAVFITGGDYSFDFARTIDRNSQMVNISVIGNNGRYCDTYGCYWDAYPDNLYAAETNPSAFGYPYSPIGTVDGYLTNGRIVGNNFRGVSGGTQYGIVTYFTRGLIISENVISCFGYGVSIKNGSQGVTVSKNTIFSANQACVSVGDSAVLPQNTLVDGNYFFNYAAEFYLPSGYSAGTILSNNQP